MEHGGTWWNIKLAFLDPTIASIAAIKKSWPNIDPMFCHSILIWPRHFLRRLMAVAYEARRQLDA